jgi:hypothetical protein
MKKMTLGLLFVGLTSSVFASTSNEAFNNISENRDATINVYGVGAKIDKNQDSSAGAGIMFDSEALKVKLEGTSDFVKTGAVLKVNPFNPNLYFKFGLNYINEKVWSPVNTSTRVNQYSTSVATGYMISDDFYAEIGGSYTKLNGEVFGDYQVSDETTSLGYLEVAKRWETGIGTLDTTANAGKVFHEFSDDEASYGVGVDYYPMDNAKLSYAYQYEKNNINNIYKAQYSYVFVEYNDDISNDTYKVTAGLAIAFDDITDFSTYRAPTNIKSHLSELNRFENIVLNKNMNLQMTKGVEKTAAAIARDANHAPVWTASSYNTGITVDDTSDNAITIKDLTAVSSDADGDVITYSIVSVSVPSSADQTHWNNSVAINNGVFQVHNLTTNDPDFNGDITVTVRASDGSSSSDTTVTFTFNNVN